MDHTQVQLNKYSIINIKPVLLSLYTAVGPVHEKPPLHKGWHKAHDSIVSFTYIYRSYYTKTCSVLIFIYSICFYLYMLQCNGGFDPHMYIPLYLFTVHSLYNHCILIRYSYYIVVTYVDFIVSYFFYM